MSYQPSPSWAALSRSASLASTTVSARCCTWGVVLPAKRSIAWWAPWTTRFTELTASGTVLPLALGMVLVWLISLIMVVLLKVAAPEDPVAGGLRHTST